MTAHRDLGGGRPPGASDGIDSWREPPDAGLGAQPRAGGSVPASSHGSDPRREPPDRRARPATHEVPTDILFRDLVMTGPPRPRDGRAGWSISAVSHVVIVSALVLVPILWPEELPHPDYVRALLYNPPPPPPPPLPKGSALIEKKEPPRPTSAEPEPRKTEPKMESPVVVEAQPKEARLAESEQFGSPHGSDVGVPEGMEEGVEGGVVGGVPGGVIGGVVGGTGDIPVADYDQPARPIRLTKPTYPQEGFVKKIEGTVVVEILIDVTGRVTRARVLQSIPALDGAALECVRQWVFAPAMKHGRPVPTLATAPVNFKIY